LSLDISFTGPETRCCKFATCQTGHISKKQVRKALDEACEQVRKTLDGASDEEAFEVQDTSARGHSWGCVRCTRCNQKISVWSTPKNADNHAKQIRRFIQRHSHADDVQDSPAGDSHTGEEAVDDD
jgi:hypothetical protein